MRLVPKWVREICKVRQSLIPPTIEEPLRLDRRKATPITQIALCKLNLKIL